MNFHDTDPAPGMRPVELDAEQVARANAIYGGLRFEPSRFGVDRTFGVLEGGQLVALGRLQARGDGALELGGFWTREDRRGRGLARRMVRVTLEQVPADTRAWCLPLAHLTSFYVGCGLRRADPHGAPASIRSKLDACSAAFGLGFRAEDLLVWEAPRESTSEHPTASGPADVRPG